VKLRHLDEWNQNRREAALRYDELLSSVEGVIRPYCPDWARAVFHLYVIRVRHPEDLQKHLAEAKIGTGIHYPVPLHLQRAYENLGYVRGDFPITEKIAAEIVSLAMFPQLTAAQQSLVVDEISRFLRTNMVPERVGARRGEPELRQRTT
jgi:dTDP-4-amino-4,6-dideoxygalactose transaminase